MVVSALVALIAVIVSLPLIVAQVSFCCEKTLTGAWCQNAPQTACNPGFRSAPTACESTSFCRTGTCFDQQEGICMENTPQRVCDEAKAVWVGEEVDSIPQCQLGCCVLADQAALVTLARCKAMSGQVGLETDFKPGITDEVTCIETAGAKEKGACVFEVDFQRTCKFVTREECGEGTVVSANDSVSTVTNTSTGFFPDILCSAEELATICGPSTETTLIEGRDEVYFKDTCSNPANIYDSNRQGDPIYWKDVIPKSESCGAGQSNAGSKTCGNCDYFRGSIGREADRTTGSPTFGDFICIDLSCEGGREHGESWCIKDPDAGDSKDRVGSRYFKNVCIFGEVLSEPCADFRNEFCVESERGGFSEARCTVNKWQDCIEQEEKDDCENTDLRDCRWVKGYYVATSQAGGSIAGIKKSTEDTVNGTCVPLYPPGLNFWGESPKTQEAKTTEDKEAFPSPTTGSFGTGAVTTPTTSLSSTDQCSIGDAVVEIQFRREVGSDLKKKDWECRGPEGFCKFFDKDELKNADSWVKEINNICTSLGDCGSSINWIGAVDKKEGFSAYYKKERFAGAGGAEKLEKTDSTETTGQFIKDLIKEKGGQPS